jgi:threonine aldolase
MSSNATTAHTSFRSDNDAGAAPQILAALTECNEGAAYPYGGDLWTQRVEEQLVGIFGCKLHVLMVSTGTAANSLALAAMTPPWGSVLCHRLAHIHTDECGAPEFYGGGLKLVASASAGSKLDPLLLATELQWGRGDVHSVQPSAVSLTQATEEGQVYAPDEVAAIGKVCRKANVTLHMDGARFANALTAVGCSPAELTWKAGVDLLSFGATKNGALNAEALVVFNEALWETLPFRRKRAGHLLSKMRFVSAQMHAYLQDDLWLVNARHANAMARRLAAGLSQVRGVTLVVPQTTNLFFVKMPDTLLQGLLQRGFDFYHDRWGPGVARLVTSFRTMPAMVDEMVQTAQELSGAA